jgi:uncharacterized protein YkwD
MGCNSSVDEIDGSSNKSSDLLDIFRAEALKAHNKYREMHNAPSLMIDLDAQRIAQNYAEKLAKNGKFEHSKSQDHQMGENIYGKFNISYSTLDENKCKGFFFHSFLLF